MAHDLLVHHFGSRTFQGNGIDTERLLQENSEKFAHKWGLPVVGQRVSVRPCVEGGNGPQMTQMNAFVWVNDFASARNAALARAKGDYAFWLDADDVLDPPQRVKLQALLDGLRTGDEAAYVVRCSCDPGPNGDGGQTVVEHIRLFPVREGVRWTYAVHEQILPALRRANVPVRWTDLTVRHTGYTDPALRERKLQHDCKILEDELAERPDDPFVLFNLGSIAVERQD